MASVYAVSGGHAPLSSLAIKAGAGLLAVIVAAGLGYAFWPRPEPEVSATRSAVEKPVFVAATTTAKPSAAPLTTQATPIAVAAAGATPAPAAAAPSVEKVGTEKLAAMMKTPSAEPLTRNIVLPSAPALIAPAPPASDDAAKLCAEGLVALADGRIASARAFLERAADAGDARALLVLGDTWDASRLAQLGAVGVQANATRAHDYYARALAAGVPEARQRLAAVDAKSGN
jgi:hypothetical protein